MVLTVAITAALNNTCVKSDNENRLTSLLFTINEAIASIENDPKGMQ